MIEKAANVSTGALAGGWDVDSGYSSGMMGMRIKLCYQTNIMEQEQQQ